MIEENFEEDSISQNVSCVMVPSLQTSRNTSTLHTERSQRFLLDSNLNIKAFNNIDEKHGSNDIKDKNRMVQNLIRQKQYKQNKMVQKKKEVQEKQMEICTFKPKTNQTGKQRSLREFLQSQYKFAKRVIQKKQNLKISLEDHKKQETFKPKTNKNLNVNIRKQPIYQRLYNLRNKQTTQENSNSSSFQPQIAERSKKLTRDLPISQYLYNDALRRQQQFKQKSSYQSPQIVQQKSLNLTNQKYVAQKFIKQFYGILEDLNLIQNHQDMDLQKFILLMSKMGFINNEQKLKQNQKNLIEQAFKYLTYYTLNLRNICVFFMALVGIYHINPINFQDGVEKHQEQELLNLDQNQGRKLQKKFDIFFRNRLYAQQVKKPVSNEVYTFKPEINSQSEILAENYRNKMLQQTNTLIEKNQLNFEIPKDGYINHIDLLNLNKLAKQVQIKKKRQLKKDENLKQCTFKPTILQIRRDMNSSNVTEMESGMKKYNQLYNLSKTLIKNTKTTTDIQFEKNEKECTFAPKINNKRISTKDNCNMGKDTEKVLARMAQARRQKQQKNKILGISYQNPKKQEKNKKKNSTSKQTVKTEKDALQQAQLPYLVIDVNLGDQTQQISVYQHQIDKPQIIAKQFSEKHGLDPESEAQLIEMLRSEIQNIVRKIDQEEEQKQSMDISQ